MDSRGIFAAVSLMMLANGGVLGLIHGDLPSTLRPAARNWLAGTLFLASGCGVFTFATALSEPVLLTLANGFFLLGLTAYYWSLQIFFGARPKIRQLLPGVLATLVVLWFSAVHPNFTMRLVLVSLVWIWLLASCAITLADRSHPDWAVSRKMLTAIFAVVAASTLARLLAYLYQDVPSSFHVWDGQNWVNLVTPVFVTMLPIIGTTAFILMCSDQLRRQWEHAASTDYLTGLANRRTLIAAGDDSFGQRARHGSRFAVAVLDIDRFKAINDTYGHDGGDQALVHVAACLRAQTRKGDLVARSGGEEFVVLLNDLDPQETEAAAERLRLSVEANPLVFDGETIPLTISAGVAIHRPADTGFASLLRRADKALYLAKARGRNRTEMAA